MLTSVSRSVRTPTTRQQKPFSHVAPAIGAALLLGFSGSRIHSAKLVTATL